MTTTWNKITKASGTSWTKIAKASNQTHTTTIGAGEPIGLLMALTYPISSTIGVGIWTDINKASGTTWTKITKAV